MPKSKRKIGLWLIGAGGNVAATVAVGLAALQKRLIATTALVTEQAAFARLGLISFEDIVLGGHEVRETTFLDAADVMRKETGVFDGELLRAVRPALVRFQKDVRRGTAAGAGPTIRKMAGELSAKSKRNSGTRASTESRAIAMDVLEGLRADLRGFQRRHKLERVVVINVASTEPAFKVGAAHKQWASMEKALTGRSAAEAAAHMRTARIAVAHRPEAMPASSLYALAAIEEGMPYVNFTPSLGVDLPAIRQRAAALGVPIMGSDGKTGETLVKSVLAPMFRDRNLDVLSWDGHNILGNLDGLVLSDPATKAVKVDSKDKTLSSVLRNKPETRVSIEYLSSLGDWKIAWDHVHFRGFLGVKMSLQFTWQGCDSILAAPLVLDLCRLADDYAARGGTGVMAHLACFFKSPMEVAERGFGEQYAALMAYVGRCAGGK